MDQVQPEVAALLSPDQTDRIKGNTAANMYGLLAVGKGIRTQQQDRAANIIGLQDEGTKRRMAADLEGRKALWQQRVGTPPENPDDINPWLRKAHALAVGMGLKDIATELGGSVFGNMQPANDASKVVGDALVGPKGEVIYRGTPIPKNPIIGSPEWQAAERFKAGLVPRDDKTLVAVEGPDGTPVLVNRSQAAGMKPWQKPGGGMGGMGQAATGRIIAENDKQSGVIDSALGELDKHPNSVGMRFGLGYVPGMGGMADEYNQRKDPDGVKLRSFIANISSLKIKDRSGAAVTISEFPRLAPFIPLVTNTPAAIRTKLKNLKAEIDLHNKALRDDAGAAPADGAPKSGKTITVNGRTFTVPD